MEILPVSMCGQVPVTSTSQSVVLATSGWDGISEPHIFMLFSKTSDPGSQQCCVLEVGLPFLLKTCFDGGSSWKHRDLLFGRQCASEIKASMFSYSGLELENSPKKCRSVEAITLEELGAMPPQVTESLFLVWGVTGGVSVARISFLC